MLCLCRFILISRSQKDGLGSGSGPRCRFDSDPDRFCLTLRNFSHTYGNDICNQRNFFSRLYGSRCALTGHTVELIPRDALQPIKLFLQRNVADVEPQLNHTAHKDIGHYIKNEKLMFFYI